MRRPGPPRTPPGESQRPTWWDSAGPGHPSYRTLVSYRVTGCLRDCKTPRIFLSGPHCKGVRAPSLGTRARLPESVRIEGLQSGSGSPLRAGWCSPRGRPGGPWEERAQACGTAGAVVGTPTSAHTHTMPSSVGVNGCSSFSPPNSWVCNMPWGHSLSRPGVNVGVLPSCAPPSPHWASSENGRGACSPRLPGRLCAQDFPGSPNGGRCDCQSSRPHREGQRTPAKSV